MAQLEPILVDAGGFADLVAGRQVADDLRKAGWVKPFCEKNGSRRPRPLFTLESIKAAVARMGEEGYPKAS